MKKYTEIYLERKEVQCILVESDVDATNKEIFEAAERCVNKDIAYPERDFKMAGCGSHWFTSEPEKYVPDFKNWPLVKVENK